MTTASDASPVTVVVTCYNQQAFVEQCLGSILAQTSAPRAVIVVDDVSPDDSADVIAHFIARHRAPFRFVRHTVNRGLCASLNEALALVDTEYLVHISADDWMLPDRIALQVAGLGAAGPRAAFAASDFVEVDEGGLELAVHDVGARIDGLTGEAAHHRLVTRLLQANMLPAPAMILRTSAVREVGGWDEDMLFEDYDMWLRLSVDHELAYAPGLATAYRIVGDSMSHGRELRAGFVRSEAACVRKLRGRDAEWDRIIDARVAALEATLEAAGVS